MAGNAAGTVWKKKNAAWRLQQGEKISKLKKSYLGLVGVTAV
jgi:hypothetical protein